MLFKCEIHSIAKSIVVLCLFSFLISGCTSNLSQQTGERRYTYHEFDGIVVYYKTRDVKIYRELLPRVFDMPDEPMVMAFVIDYYKMDKETEPYKEAAIFLMAKYEGKPAWHCITMPVTSNEARWAGIWYLGYPKIMGDVNLLRNVLEYKGTFKLKDRTVMSITHNAKNHVITDEEIEWFQKMKGIPNLNILRGKVFQPKFGSSKGQYTPLEIAKAFPEKFQIFVGKAKLFLNPKAAGEHSERLAKISSIKPTRILLAYYFKNKITSRFQE